MYIYVKLAMIHIINEKKEVNFWLGEGDNGIGFLDSPVNTLFFPFCSIYIIIM